MTELGVAEWTDHEDAESNTHCQACGSKVTLQFRRVFGTNNDVVHACPECSTYAYIHDGGAADRGVSE